MYDTDEINKIEILPLLGYELKKAGGYHVGACPFCGGRDRFTVKHTSAGDRWHCRQCGDGKYHGAIDFIMLRDRVSFLDACKLLVGDGCNLVMEKTTQQPRPAKLPDLETQAAMFLAMESANDALLSPAGEAARAYLTRRGLSRGTWYAWHLGSATVWDPTTKTNRPAISIPWYHDEAEREFITAIKYRFIDDDPQGLRYKAELGSQFILYGLWDAIRSARKLLLVEGEINALSLWQCHPVGVTVLSIGSQDNARAETLQAVAAKYDRVIVWCDDAEQARKYRDMIGQGIGGIQSPTVDGLKLDANTLLQAGKLQEFIRRVIGVECE